MGEPTPPLEKPAIDNKTIAPTALPVTKKAEPIKKEPTPPTVAVKEDKALTPAAPKGTTNEKKVDDKLTPSNAKANTPQNDKKPEPPKKEPTPPLEKPAIDNKTIAPTAPSVTMQAEPIKKEPTPPIVAVKEDKALTPDAPKGTTIEKKVDDKSTPSNANPPQHDKKSESLKKEPTPPPEKPATDNKTITPT